jgi:hypothetical protein
MVKHWAEFARSGVTYATMGVYTNPGLLGNSLRRRYGGTLLPNAGWYFMSWFKSLQGSQLPVSRWDTRHYQAADGVATWDPGARTVTMLLGGEDNDVDVKFLGLAARGLGSTVRVRLDEARWTIDPYATDTRVEDGGDPQSAPDNLFDKTFTLDASGNLTVPVHRMAQYSGYRIVISAPAAAGSYPTKYEAEAADRTDAVLHNGSDAVNASGGGYVGGIDHPDSALTFHVNAPAAGIYTMDVRYANGLTDPATHTVTVNGVPQEPVRYPSTLGWSPSELRTATTRVLLAAGANTIRLGRGDGYAEVDDIDVRPDTHRYEAEAAAITDAHASVFDYDYLPGYVGGVDNADSQVDFTVDVPVAGAYRLDIGYANATTGTSTHQVLVNGAAQGSGAYPPTGSWLDGPTQDAVEKLASVTVNLATGVNHVVLRKATGYAELDFLTVNPAGGVVTPPTTAPPTTAPPAAGCTATWHVDNDWGSGHTATVTVTAGSGGTREWHVTWNWPGRSLVNAWNATVTTTGTTFTAANLAYNGALAPGGTTTFGLQATGSGTPAPVPTCTAS